MSVVRIVRDHNSYNTDHETAKPMCAEYCCKVDRIRAAHDISPPGRAADDLNTYLVDRWTGRGEAEPTGIRTLAEWFNKQVLRAVYRDHGRPDSSVRIDSDYAALQGEEIPDYERAELLSELEDDGIDGESTARQFVGKSTLGRHLKGCLDAIKDTPKAETEWEIDRIRIATGNYRSHLESALGSLGTKDRITGIDEAELQIQTYLSCPHCPTRVTVETAYEQGYVCAEHHDTAE